MSKQFISETRKIGLRKTSEYQCVAQDIENGVIKVPFNSSPEPSVDLSILYTKKDIDKLLNGMIKKITELQSVVEKMSKEFNKEENK